jgi:hypothetical protein
MNNSQKKFYPRHTAAYGGLACEKWCKGREAYNRRILCEVTRDDDHKKKQKLENTKFYSVTCRRERGLSGIMQ